jgi:hypothetical protein
MTKLRKMTADDRTILAKVLKTHGAKWTYKALAVWYGNDFDQVFKGCRWTRLRMAAFRFLRDITRDYTFGAVYGAALAIKTPAHLASLSKK